MNTTATTEPKRINEAAIALRKRMADNLVAIGRDKDEVAFTDFYDYYAGRVKSFLMGKGMSDEISDELSQEIMIIVWRRAESYDPAKAAASTWLFTIARNRRIDYLRGNSRVEVELDDEMLDKDNDDSEIQAKFVDDAQAAVRLQSALEKLPPEQQKVIQLSYFRGQSHGAIANLLDLPIGTVKSRIRLAMHAVRVTLQGDGGDPP